jgi:hypothetical protein
MKTLFYSPNFWDSPTWRASSPYLYPLGIEWPSYSPGYWVPFSSPLTTSRAYSDTMLYIQSSQSITNIGDCVVISMIRFLHRKDIRRDDRHHQLVTVYGGSVVKEGMCVTAIWTSICHNQWFETTLIPSLLPDFLNGYFSESHSIVVNHKSIQRILKLFL